MPADPPPPAPPPPMRAAFCTGRGQVELREVAAPAPSTGEVVVAVHACGICGSDLHYYAGGATPPAVCMGHEICGRVLDPSGRPGKAVVVEPLAACGACARCRAGEPNLCPDLRVLGTLAPGGLADRVAAPAQAVYPVPPGLPLDHAVLAEPLAVVVHAAHLAALAAGDEVLVLGGGTIGLLAAFVARRAGARVTLTARHPHQRAAAEALGVTRVVEADDRAVRTAARAHRPDVVLETVGGAATTVELALRVVRPGGRIVALGVFHRPITLDPVRFLLKEAHLVASMTYCRRGARADFAVALDLLAAHHRSLAPLVTHRAPLTEVARAFALAADKASGAIKVAVDVASG